VVRGDGVLVFRDEQEIGLETGITPIQVALGHMRLGRFTYRTRLDLVASDQTSLARAETAFAVEDYAHAYNAAYYQDVEWSPSG
jgi:hypothetical protein